MNVCSYCGGAITFRYIGGVCTPVHLIGGCSGDYSTFRANNYTEVEGRNFEISKLYSSDYTEKDFCQPTKCPKCEQKVFFIRHNGGSVWIDELGYPWTKHPCMDNSGWKDINILLKAEIQHMTFGLCIKVKVVEIKKDNFLTYVAVLFSDKTTKIFCLEYNARRLLSHIVSIGKNKKNTTVVYSPDSISYVVLNDRILSDDIFNEIEIVEKIEPNSIQSTLKKQKLRKEPAISVEKIKKDTDDFAVKGRIVTDKKTRLMWLNSCLYQLKKSGKRVEHFSYSSALTMKDTFNQLGGFGNYTDWRIPTINELKKLVGRKEILNNLNANDGKYWTSSRIVSAGAYYDTYVYTYVNMNAGNVKNASLHEMCKVQLVRGGR
jgi:hypothetical protein